MMLQTIFTLVLASGRSDCRAVPVAEDLVLSEGRCGEEFHGGRAGKHDLISVSRDYPDFNLALFTFRGRWRGRIAGLNKDDGLFPGAATDQGTVDRIDARWFHLRGDPDVPFVFRARRLLGIRTGAGEFIRVANYFDWLELKIGGD